MSEIEEKKAYKCENVEDALAMLDAVDKFLDSYQKLKEKYYRATKKLERLFGVKEKRSIFSPTSSLSMDRAMRQMFEQIVYEVLTKQGILRREEEEAEEEIEEIDKFFEEEKPKEKPEENKKDSME